MRRSILALLLALAVGAMTPAPAQADGLTDQLPAAVPGPPHCC